MVTEQKALSVVIPVHNGERFIAQALHSIVGSIGGDIQIVVVDDASTDGTRDLIENLGKKIPELRYLRVEQNVGPGPARNIGLAETEGRYVGLLDADDWYADGALEYMASQLDANPGVDIVMGRVQPMRSSDESQQADSFTAFGGTLRCFQLGSILLRAEVLKTVGNFNAAFRCGEDIDWFLRAQEAKMNFLLNDQIVLNHRRHDENISDRPDNRVDLALVMRASLKRRQHISEVQGVPVEDIYYIRPDSTS